MFNLYIKRAAEIFGVTHTREIYEKAIEVLTDDKARYERYTVRLGRLATFADRDLFSLI